MLRSIDFMSFIAYISHSYIARFFCIINIRLAAFIVKNAAATLSVFFFLSEKLDLYKLS